MSSSKRKKNKKLARGVNRGTQPTTRAMALNNEKEAVKRLPVDPLTIASSRDSIKIAAELKAPAKSGPVVTESPPIGTATTDIGGERTPNMIEGDVFDFGFASQMQLFAKMLQAPLTILLHQQAVLTQVLLNSRYPKDTGTT